MDQRSSPAKTIKPTTAFIETILGSRFLRDVFYAGLMYVALRLLSTFLFSELEQRSWSIERHGGWLPIIAFRTDLETYTTINTASTVMTATVLMLVSLRKVAGYMWFTRHERAIDMHVEAGMRNRTTAWTMVSIITAPQMLVAWMVNNWAEIEINTWAYWVVPLTSLCSLLVYRLVFLPRAASKMK